MKALKIIVAVLLLFIAGSGSAQFSFSINLPPPPMWGPVGYTQVRYYYLPDVEAYYDVRTSMFIYYGGGAWIHRAYLPARYKGYDLYSGYKVVMPGYHGKTPYIHHSEYKKKYGKGYRGRYQKTIGPKPGKGNSDSHKTPGDNHKYNRGGSGHTNNADHRNNKDNSKGNARNKKKDHGHQDGNGKKK